MTELKFAPDQWVDELTAEPAISPDLFIGRDGTGWKLRPADPDEASDTESFAHAALAHGDVVLFREHRHFGSHTLSLDENGVATVDPEPPQYANCFGLPDYWESMAHNIPDLIEWNQDEIKPDSQVDIDIWWWSDNTTPWQFVVEGETAKFVKFVGQA